jgi:glycosyltransferase involved in cell wall biosynthesis
MQVLHINTFDMIGGAAIAAYRLHRGLLAQHVQSRLLVDKSQSDSDLVSTISRRRYFEDISGRLGYHLGLNNINMTSTFKVPNHRFYIESDILNFHNLHGNYFNYLSIPTLTRHKPAVLTLHDMWSFTGHCAYSFDCDRWQPGCGKCPHLDTYPSVSRDCTALEWNLKRWIYNRSNLVIVAPSRWLARLAEKSILSRFSVHVIPNGLDTNVYKPLEKKACRDSLGIPADKTVLLFAAQSLKDPRKGGDLLLNALQKIPQNLAENIVLLMLGEESEILKNEVNIPMITLGYIGGDRVKAIAYSAADIFVFPTRADNLPLVIQESMACGTPTISFDVGGVSELVRPRDTGLLAEPENIDDFAEKIVNLVENMHMRQHMSAQCRITAEKEYSLDLQTKRYITLYKDIIQNL